jgi:hypothetical protein
MTRISQDSAMGIAIVVACLLLWFRESWFLANTGKGQRLVQRFGTAHATWVLRAILLGFGLLGGMLATGIIRPIQW